MLIQECQRALSAQEDNRQCPRLLAQSRRRPKGALWKVNKATSLRLGLKAKQLAIQRCKVGFLSCEDALQLFTPEAVHNLESGRGQIRQHND